MAVKLGKKSFACIVLLISSPLFAGATNKASSENINHTPELLFEEFEDIASSGNTDEYLRLVNQFNSHPLFPYAKASYLSKTLSIDKKAVINEFVNEFKGAPFTNSLEVKWLHYLANNNYRDAFFDAFQYGIDLTLDCQYLSWQLDGNAKVTSLHNEIVNIWVSNKSLPKQCDGVFNKWFDSNLVTSDIVLKRIELAALSKNFNLVRYLKRYLPEHKKYLSDLWIKAASKPNSIYQRGFFLLKNKDELAILRSQASKLAFANPERFYKWWVASGKSVFSKIDGSVYVDKTVAVALAVNKSPISLTLLNELPDDTVDESVKQWRLARALATNNWNIVLTTVNQLPELFQVDPAVVFWRARSEMEIGNLQYATRLLSELAERRDYYGFMAASALGQKLKMRHEPLEIEASVKANIENHPTFQRALALFNNNSLLRARQEWNYLVSDLPDDLMLAAAELAAESGWVDRPIFTLSKVDYLNDVELRFPLAFNDIIQKHALNSDLPASLIYAIIRRESSFIEDAFSSAGAAGLMQIKPATASVVARQRISKYDLFEPDTNLLYATSYLEKLLSKTDQNLVLAAASYNAGFNRVKKWLPKTSIDADAWIESIPYKETRNYVKAVVAYKQVYQHLLNEETSITADITSLTVEPEI